MNPATAVNSSTDVLPSPVASEVSDLLSQGVKVRQARFEDQAQVEALQIRNGLRPTRDWLRLWSGNPAFYSGTSIGWVLESPATGVVGFLGNIPLDYQYCGRCLRAATAHSWVVDQGYRGRSVELLDQFLRQPAIDLFVFTTVNAAAERVLRAFRFEQVPAGQWNISAFWVTSHGGLFKSAIRALKAPHSGVSLLFGSSVRKLLQRRRDELTLPLKTSSYVWKEHTEFDARFDDLWKELSEHKRDRLIASRDRATLQWRYQRAIARKDVSLIAAEADNRLLAYAVFDRFDHAELNLRRIRFVDFQAQAGYDSLVYSALEWMLRKCHQEGVHVAENVGCWLEELPVPVKAPFHRKMKSWLYYYKARDPELARQLMDSNVWAVSSYDGDASLS